MNIGDLIMRVLINDKAFDADLQKTAQKSGDKAGKTLGSRIKTGLSAPFKGTKGDLLGLIGLGAGIGIATVAVGKLVDVMGDAVAAAIEEEKSIAKLDAALKANVEGYDGNSQAIEKVLASRMRLGFADDEQRESLALLVAATKDYNKALDIQRVAMDLARFKGISLKEASEALIKVEAGQFRILKTLGIQLPKNATATQALAAVQKVATGQAEAFAETSEGKLLASQIKVGEAMEKLGALLLPLVTEAAETASDAIETLSEAFDETGDAAKDSQDPIVNLANILHDLFKDESAPAKTFLGSLFDGLNDVAEASQNLASNINDAWTFWDQYTDAAEDARIENEQVAESAREAGRGLGVVQSSAEDAEPPLDNLGDTAKDTGRKLTRAAGDASQSWRDYADEILGLARDKIEKAYQIIDDKAALNAANVETAELAKVIATGKATDAQKERYRELGEEQALLLIDLAENGVKSGKEVETATKQMRGRLKTAVGQEKKAILELLTVIGRVGPAAREQYASLSRLVAAIRPIGLPSGPQERAMGGPVQAGQPYIVGEHRPELFVPRIDGTILPTVPDGWGGAGGSGPSGDTYYQIQMTGLPHVERPSDIGAGLRMLDDQGYLPRR